MLHRLMKPISNAAPSRRSFLKLSAGAAGGLLIGLRLPGASGAAIAAEGELAQPFVHIRADNTVTVIVKHLDKGQGAATGLATLVADELDATHEQIRVEFAPADTERYKNLLFGVQGTGGSTAIANSFQQYRTAGAAAKAMLVAAAAKAWGVPAAEIAVSGGELSHADGRKASFGEMAGLAAAESVPESPRLKAPEEWTYIGKSFPRLDTKMKTVGAPGVYGMDHKARDMLVAVVAHPPKFGAKPKTVEAAAAKAVPGVVEVLTLPAGVAVVAEKTWPAIRARELLEITWDETEAETRGSDEMLAELQAMVATPGLKAHAHGDAEAGLANAVTVIEADYSFPFLAHAPMEPLDVTILFDGTTAELWTGSQLQTVDQNVAAAVLGITPDKVAINTLWAGGSFGRRAQPDSHPVAEAAHIARAWVEAGNAPRPVKVVWTREDDIKGGYYRPMVAHKVRAGIDADGNITGWQHRIASKSILIGSPFEAFLVKDGIDETTVEGVSDMSYAVAALDVEAHNAKTAVPVLWWRSVGHTHTAYVVETMIDRLAKAAGKDPVAFREGLLKDDPRRLGVLRLAAEKAGWNDPLPEGRYRGVAVHKSFNTYVAEVAEISLRADGTVKVEKVTCAVDCGVPVNPDNIRAQMEGGIGYGLGAVLRNEITMTAGEVDQSNFDTYLPLRISDMPRIEVHVVPSTEAPTGAGEPGTPPIGPAVANAIAAAKGEWITALPLSRQGLS